MIDLDTNLLMQKALSLYLENGMFQKNLKHIKQLLKQREDSLVTFLNKYHPNLNYRLTPTHLIINCDKSILLPSSWPNPMINLVVTDKTRYLTIAITQDIQKTLALLFAH